MSDPVSSAVPSRVRAGLESLALAALAGIFYLLTASQNLSLAHDGLTYLNWMEEGLKVAYPHHLLYHWLGAWWLHFWKALLPGCSSVCILEAWSSVHGAACVGLFHYLFRRRLGMEMIAAALGAALLGVTFGLWYFSVCLGAYVPAFFWALASLVLLSGPRLSSGRMAGVGAFQALAVLSHLQYALLVPVTLVAVARIGTGRVRGLLAWGGVLGAVCAAVFGWTCVSYLGLRSAAEVSGWFAHYSDPGVYLVRPGLQSLSWAAVGVARCLLGGSFVFALPAGMFQAGFLEQHSLLDERFMVRGIPASLAVALLIGCAVFAVGLVGAGLRARSARHEPSRGGAALIRLAAAWLLVFSLFFLFWIPYLLEFWIPQVACAGILLVAGLSRLPRADQRAWLGALASAALVINLLGSVGPAHDSGNDYYAALVRPLVRGLGRGDLVILGSKWQLEPYARHLGNSRVINLSDLVGRGTEASSLWDSLRVQAEGVLSRRHAVRVSHEAMVPSGEYPPSLQNGILKTAPLWRELAGRDVVIESSSVSLELRRP